MKKMLIRVFMAIIICWGLFIAIEGIRLIGSTDPGKKPLFYISGTHIQNELSEYNSVGLSQVYHLSEGDIFLYGEFYILGTRVTRWKKDD